MLPRILSVLFLLAITAARVPAQWRQTNSPGANAVDVLRNINGNLYAGTRGNGVFVLRNDNWVPLNNGLTNFTITDLIGADGSLIVGTNGGGIFRSDNGGQQWVPINNGITVPDVDVLAFYNNALFAACSRVGSNGSISSGLYRSVNGGQSWQALGGITSGVIYSSFTLIDSELYLGYFGGIVKTSNSGNSWVPVGRDLDFLAFYVTRVLRVQQKFYAATIGAGVRVSADNGATWQSFSQGLLIGSESNQVYDLLVLNGAFYASTAEGVFRRPFESDRWTPYSGGLGSYVISSLVAFQGVVYAGTMNGQMYSDNGPHAQLVATSAATYLPHVVSSGAIAALFAPDLSPLTLSATTIPLPSDLGGVDLRLTDTKGQQYRVGMFFVSPAQINYLVPSAAAKGPALISLTRPNSPTRTGFVFVTDILPGIFTASGDGAGPPAALHLQIAPNGTRTFRAVYGFDEQAQRWVPAQIRLGGAGFSDFLVVYGTGLRSAQGVVSLLRASDLSLQGNPQAAAVAGFVGLDQVNVGLTTQLQGRGFVDLTLTIREQTSNVVRVLF